jgi:CheY-like chemotaxis protein
VLADIAMPGQDGYALMRAMREVLDADAHRIRAIAVSAYARLEDKQLAERAGFNEHLAKPIHREELFDTIERIWVH